jgi:sterol desaturase/sphingolipid hydroxylase (fatty acid hydroxylase superfamily)
VGEWFRAGISCFVFIIPIQPSIDICFKQWIQSIPPLHTMFLQLFGGCVLFDTLFYFGHRLAHLPIFYQFHKQHHLFTYPCALTGTYLSPVDSVFIQVCLRNFKRSQCDLVLLTLSWLCFSHQSLFPCFFSAYVFNMHLVTFWMFTILHITHSAYDHCGYEFPFSPFSLIPFAGHVRPHNFHHTHIVGNFAIYFRFWDWLFGTDQAYLLFEKERMQKQMLANQDAAQYSSGTDTDSDRRPRRRTSQPCPRSPSSKQ